MPGRQTRSRDPISPRESWRPKDRQRGYGRRTLPTGDLRGLVRATVGAPQVGKRPQRKTCEPVQGILFEGEEVMDDFAESEALDAGLLAAAQAVKHSEIAGYGTLRSWAAQLGMNNASTLLEDAEHRDEAMELTRSLIEKIVLTAREEGGVDARLDGDLLRIFALCSGEQKGPFACAIGGCARLMRRLDQQKAPVACAIRGCVFGCGDRI